MSLKKVRVQLLNENTGDVIDEVDVLTSADAVTFADGETFQQKLNAGKLTGAKGDKGERGEKGEMGSQGAKGSTGTSMRFKGTWSSSVAYVCDANYVDIVTSGGNSYRCKTSNTNQAVTNTTYWELISQKGDKGDRGEQGLKGEKGDRGEKGADGADGAGVSIGTSLGSATQGKLFFKVVG